MRALAFFFLNVCDLLASPSVIARSLTSRLCPHKPQCWESARSQRISFGCAQESELTTPSNVTVQVSRTQHCTHTCTRERRRLPDHNRRERLLDCLFLVLGRHLDRPLTRPLEHVVDLRQCVCARESPCYLAFLATEGGAVPCASCILYPAALQAPPHSPFPRSQGTLTFTAPSITCTHARQHDSTCLALCSALKEPR